MPSLLKTEACPPASLLLLLKLVMWISMFIQIINSIQYRNQNLTRLQFWIVYKLYVYNIHIPAIKCLLFICMHDFCI